MNKYGINLDQIHGLVKERNTLYQILAEIIREATAREKSDGVAVIHTTTFERARKVLREVGDETL
ncbi:MAG: hypothetical protein AB1509_14255 [Chloroflexota bacterium]